MSDLFRVAAASRPKPLAATVRPTSLEDIIGQEHILGPTGVLRRKVASGRLGCIVLYGPAGVGKTSIARAVGATMRKEFRPLHPAQHKAADIDAVAEEAQAKDILVFVDEIHRYSTTVQERFLALTEDGVFDFIAATTGNPYHSLATGLVSRSTVLQLEPLKVSDLEKMVLRAIERLKADGYRFELEDGAINQIAARANGDGRRAVNTLEDCVAGWPKERPVRITMELVAEILQSSPIPYDKTGDAHYDVISAWIKSMRGSDPDGTLYWLARLIHSGEDPRFIARRLLVHASEDVGLADNSVIATCVAALNAVTHVGMPEASIILSHAALHIARAPKSNSAYRGIHHALDYVKNQAIIPVPPYLKDAHYAGAAKLGHVGYQFPHDDDRGWVEQDYAPGIFRGQFYQSDARDGATFERRADQYWEQVTGQPAIRKS